MEKLLKLNPIKSEKIWGYELWIASTHPNGCQDDFKQAVGGLYPLLVKVIQANEALSIQVHPDDEWAVKLEGQGNRGKTECWYVLSAEPGAKIVYGIKEGYSNDVLAKAIQDKNMEQYLEMYEVHPGDFIFIPAGTVHAIGGGLRLMEVQQSCDLTYRLYDWGRDREVHIEKGLSVIKREDMIPIAPFPKTFECKYFSMDEVTVKGGWSMLCSKGDKPLDTQLLYIISADKAVIRANDEKISKPIMAEEIYAVAPGDKITVEGSAKIMKIKALID